MPAELFAAAIGGERMALARLMSMVEAGSGGVRELDRLAHERSGRAHTVGITGAPGAGKSTLTALLIAEARRAGDEVAVLAIDPSSPFTGGAILGDRVRMQSHALDDGVFIRSMATRGHQGGLALAAPAAVRVLDAVGFGWVLLETVGVGQVEVDVAGTADTTVVVVNPGWGDAVQASKAGLLEVADVFVVNKADRPGVEEVRRDLELMLDLAGGGSGGSVGGRGGHGWRPPIVTTVATSGEGVGDAWAAVVAHRDHSTAAGALAQRRADRLTDELRALVARRLHEQALLACTGPDFDVVRARVLRRELDPWAAADLLTPT